MGEYGGSLITLVKKLTHGIWNDGKRTNVLWRKYTELYNDVGRPCGLS